MTRSRVLAALAVMTFTVVACEDDFVTEVGPVGRSAFAKYVSMGTSVSMGVRNGYNAATAETQIGAWPSLLARQAGAANYRLPLFRPGGCLSPSIAPISLGMNLAGRPQANPLQPDTICAGLVSGITLPTNNVAVSGHTVAQAHNLTPTLAAANLSASELPRRKIMPLIMLPNQTQVTAMTSQKPTFVSVELGANDVLSAASGVAIVGATITTPQGFDTMYTKIIDSVKSTKAKALLVTLPTALASAPSMRTGAELHADSVTFSQGFYITVGSACKDANAANVVFVPGYVFTNIAIGRARAAAGAPRHVMTCADSGLGKQDFVITPAELATITTAITGFNTTITNLANENGYAVASLNDWWTKPKPAFSVAALVSSTTPYGTYFGLDGVHPSAAGQIVIANSAIEAINAKYKFTIPLLPNPAPTS